MAKIDRLAMSVWRERARVAWPRAEWPTPAGEAVERRPRASRGLRAHSAGGESRRRPKVGALSAHRRSALVIVGYSACLALCDSCIVIATAACAAFLYHAWWGGEPITYSMSLIGSLAAVLFALPCAARGEYVVPAYLSFEGHAKRTALLWSLVFLCLLTIGFVTKTSAEASRSAVTIFYFGGFASLLATRALLVVATRAQARAGGLLCRRIFLVGFESEIAVFRKRYEASMLGMNLVGAFALRGGDHIQADLALAAASARFLRPDEVVIVAPWSRRRLIDACVEAFRRVPASIRLASDPRLAQLADACNFDIGRASTIELVRPPLSNAEVLLKRSIDLAGAGIGLVLLSPLLAVVALLIKLDSPGPVIFSQRRYGFNQEPFRIFKFRSMTTMEDGRNVVQACRNDARVTRVGRWLRRFSIDEFPQLVNVLRGEMSLVGPRPHAFAHDQNFGQSIAPYARRHNMKPGITGWAQVNGFRGEIKSEKDIRRRVKHDLYYIDNWSIRMDLLCLWRTVASSRAWRNVY